MLVLYIFFSFYYIHSQIYEADLGPLEERTWYKEGLSNRRAFIIVRLGNGHIFWVNFWYSVYLRTSFANRVSRSWYIIRRKQRLGGIYGINLLTINRHATISSSFVSGHFSFWRNWATWICEEQAFDDRLQWSSSRSLWSVPTYSYFFNSLSSINWCTLRAQGNPQES